ncbi:EAL domain-containing protein [Legionella quateirensis]|uniref:Rtn protein n=1 Tax=Legionella quateirensis TaxID=45072 RepID=A0A378KUA4_9GAMM|nr:EAL domain-containing protein [Legionella quateirensis]KTD50829.1 Rtn protein [Legionella quateirensis]STY17926.1 Rtn protein [Legionella quateirensis]
MSKVLKEISQLIVKQFNYFWILITILVLLFSLYTNWHLSINRTYKKITDVATLVSNRVDGFIEDLFQEVYTLPVYGKSFTDCKSGLYPYLEHITLNNENIAGISISDNRQQLICSSLPNNESIISSTTHARTLTGPFKLPLFDQPLYLVQQKMGNYHIGILVVSSILQNILKISDKNVNSVALYNNFEKRNIIRVERTDDNRSWKLSQLINEQTPTNTKELYVIDKTQSIDGVVVVVFENHQTLISNLLYSELLVTLIILLSSALIYHLLKKVISKRYSLQGAIKLAIKNNEFYPEYQPLFNCKKGSFTGVEVLVRWRDSEDQLIMPDFFIAEAETTGLIVPLTLQIIEISLRETQFILQENSEFHLAYNLSALHFTDPSFFTEFDLLARQFAISPSQIIFEITERELLDKNNSVFIGTMNRLREVGYSLAVDDYGTGHASISYLQHFPFNYLKIDKLFVQAIGTKAITESLNDAIIQMAKGLNLIIIAEGVETKEQVDYLSNNGVRFLQGWYFSKALPIDKLVTLLKGEKE